MGIFTGLVQHYTKTVHDKLVYLQEQLSVVDYVNGVNRRTEIRERDLIPDVNGYFRTQRDELLQLFDSQIQPLFFFNTEGLVREQIEDSDWVPLWNAVAESTSPILEDSLNEAGEKIYIPESRALVNSLGLSQDIIDFEIVNEVAIGLNDPEKTVSGINDTTQSRLNEIIDDAVESGASYNQLSRQIGGLFTSFNTKEDINGNTRSDRISFNEVRVRQQSAGAVTAQALIREGLTIEKAWITRNDDKVRPEHTANQSQGFIAEDRDFQSGNSIPPTDPGCRCVNVRQVA